MILHGDCLELLPTLAADSVDAGVTDPPYGLGFMGKEWDTFKPDTLAARKVLHRGGEDGPIVSDNPNLHGRHRSPAVSPSQIEYDRSLAGQRAFQAWNEQWARELYRVLKPGAYLLVCGAPRSSHRMTCGVEEAGFEIRDCFAWLFGSGFPKSMNFDDGWGTALKPGHEPIVIARKPFRGGLEANRAAHGTGALNIDACRLPAEQLWTRSIPDNPAPKFHRTHAQDQWTREEMAKGANTEGSDLGRWPANVLLDELAAAMLDTQTGELVSGANPTRRGSDKFRDVYAAFAGQAECQPARGVDRGGASRFFYVAKPDRTERDRGCDSLAPRQRDESRDPGAPGGNNPRNRGTQLRANHHPTVKPLELMRWLVRLVTPTGGKVIDPFFGSGTVGMACVYEGFDYIGIEREQAYVAIAEARIADCLPLLSQASEDVCG